MVQRKLLLASLFLLGVVLVFVFNPIAGFVAAVLFAIFALFSK